MVMHVRKSENDGAFFREWLKEKFRKNLNKIEARFSEGMWKIVSKGNCKNVKMLKGN